MTMTVKQIVDEYLSRRDNAEYEEIVITAGNETYIFKNVTNLKNVTNYKLTGPDTYEFDYAELEAFGEYSYHHVSITGTIIMKSQRIKV